MATELEQLKQRVALAMRLDEKVELAEQRRLDLAGTLELCLPLLRDATGADRIWIETTDSRLDDEFHSLDGVDVPADLHRIAHAAARDAAPRPGRAQWSDERVHACVVDVAGDDLGTLALTVADDASAPDNTDVLLQTAAEVLDNYIVARQRARLKQLLVRRIHEALRHPVVGEGVRRAVEALGESVQFDVCIVLYHLEEDDGHSLHYLVFRGKQLELASGRQVANELDHLLARHGRSHPSAEVLIRNAEVEYRRLSGEDLASLSLDGDDEEAMLRELGFEDFLETKLIGGLLEDSPVGKIVVGSRRETTVFEQDVFDLFADILQKRIVDYGRAGHDLHRTFALPTVVRLLDEPDHHERLVPQSADIGILYADISSFTRLSEQVLGDPTEVGDLIETFSREAVRILWENGGIFDKLVGDCVIGLFGPPYYDDEPAQLALSCARAAAEISRFMREDLRHDPSVRKIVEAGEPLGVATGINFCPASVGIFGPNHNFTAFSPGMNNTARLQAVAVRDEVLVLDPMQDLIIEALPTARFGELRHEKVKNVSEPLPFRALDCASVL